MAKWPGKCGSESETINHVFTWPAETRQWREPVKIITDWVQLNRGRPNLVGTPLNGINKWSGQHGHVTPGKITPQLKATFKHQTYIWWEMSFKWFLPTHWKVVQHEHFKELKSTISGCHFISSLIKNYGMLHGTCGNTETSYWKMTHMEFKHMMTSWPNYRHK